MRRPKSMCKVCFHVGQYFMKWLKNKINLESVFLHNYKCGLFGQ